MRETFRLDAVAEILVKICLLIGVLAPLSIAPNAVAQESTRRDGNWWLARSEPVKIGYVTGFFDGMDLGKNLSIWKHISDKGKVDAVALAIESYDEYSAKYFTDVTSGQLLDGLNVFYADFQNRRIRIGNAVWLVVNQIAGTPTVKDMILNFRQNAK